MRTIVMPINGGATPPLVDRIASACGSVCVPESSHAAQPPPLRLSTCACAELKLPKDTCLALSGHGSGYAGAPCETRFALMFWNRSRLFQLARRSFGSVRVTFG